MDVHKMLEQVKAGQLDIAEAEAKLKDLPYEDLAMQSWTITGNCVPVWRNYFCQGKPDPYLKEIFLKFYEETGKFLEPEPVRPSMS